MYTSPVRSFVTFWHFFFFFFKHVLSFNCQIERRLEPSVLANRE